MYGEIGEIGEEDVEVESPPTHDDMRAIMERMRNDMDSLSAQLEQMKEKRD